MNAAQHKSDLRKKLLLQRKRLAKNWVEKTSNAIIANCITIIDLHNITGLHTYVSIPDSGEVSTWHLLQYIWQKKPEVTTYVPVVRDDSLHSVRVYSDSQWQIGKYAIPEPQDAQPVHRSDKWQVILVPVLGFDSKGHRLGYGTGYYDRFLLNQPEALTIGLAYQSCLIADELPKEPHDIPLKMIVTEDSVYDFRRQTSNLK